MKKIFSLVVAFIVVISTLSVYGATTEDTLIHTLAGYGIIDANDSTDDLITRGEFSHIVARLLGYNTSDASSETHYWDIPEDYEYAGDVAILTQIGILNGVSENLFAPDDYLTYEQAIKVLVLITGYKEIAEREGGWTAGYLSVASRNSMLKGVNLQNPFSRKDLYRLVYNTLDVSLISEVITAGNNGELVKSGETLRDKLANGSEYQIYKHKGVIVANSFSYITSPYKDLCDDEVVIDDRTEGKSFIFKIGKTDAYNLIGQEVDFYFKADEYENYELLSVKATVNNEVKKVNAQDIGVKNGTTVSYLNEHDKNEKITLEDDLKVIYNGTRLLNYGENVFNLKDGNVVFINNDNDKAFEIAMVWEYQNAIADKFDGQRFDFKADARFNDLTALFVSNEDKSVKMDVFDKNGNRVESFDTPHTVSICVNNDKTRYTIFVSNDVIEGKVESRGKDVIAFNGVDYEVSASLQDELVIGRNYYVYLNYEGKIAFAEVKGEVMYAYILEFAREGRNRISANLIIPGKVDDGIVTNEEDVTDTSRVPYLILQNSGTQILNFAEKVRCDGEKYSGNDLFNLLSEPDMKAISYELNENGEISKITPLEKVGGDVNDRYQYDVYDRVFGGTTVDQSSGFAINSSTVVACVPVDTENNIITDVSDNDILLKINITVANNDVGYRVEGYDFDPETKKARFLVAHANMDADYVPSLTAFASKPALVTNVRYVLNEETDEMEQEIELLNGSSVKKLKPITLSSGNEKIANLKIGDLIVYTTNNNDYIQNVVVICNVTKLSEEKVINSTSSSVKTTFGTAGRIEFDEIDTYNRKLVTKLEVFVNGSFVHTYSIPQTNKPSVYIYNSGEQSFTSGALQDIRPDGEKIYIFERSGDALVRAIVLVR